MGAGSSKPDAAGGSKHVFSSNSSIQFSSNLVDALQSTSEVRFYPGSASTTKHKIGIDKQEQTDSSRAKAIELEIQNRVAQELQRLREREQQTMAEIEKRLASAKDAGSIPVTAATAPVAPASTGPVGSLNLDAPRIPFAGREYDSTPVAAPPAESAEPTLNREISRETVNTEIEALRARLDGRRKLADLDEGVAKAQSNVIGCLRLNDRRPLDCWQEVDAFKKEVARMEAAFVDRIVG
ncbi:hypothetical protein N7532_002827 [Penicillium argentinense]|uniref:Altered inheritance of mitochondria protein 13, mitochondrial n=1 Tax=Penicillium argentinense TaxID=1131581 RepID=A0A9W9G2P6_9EURO|nr:uncharacterized protein N7532_002827 [Penicillium argentinense]KAJ5110182.1 hypothetical protein N7532_002827 [Penicillium argentinense]